MINIFGMSDGLLLIWSFTPLYREHSQPTGDLAGSSHLSASLGTQQAFDSSAVLAPARPSHVDWVFTALYTIQHLGKQLPYHPCACVCLVWVLSVFPVYLIR